LLALRAIHTSKSMVQLQFRTVVLNLPSGHKFVRENVLCAAGVAKAVSVDMAVAWVSHYC